MRESASGPIRRHPDQQRCQPVRALLRSRLSRARRSGVVDSRWPSPTIQPGQPGYGRDRRASTNHGSCPIRASSAAAACTGVGSHTTTQRAFPTTTGHHRSPGRQVRWPTASRQRGPCPVCGRAELRSNDLIGRFGGEEFTILLPGTTISAGLTTAERLRRRITERISSHLAAIEPITSSSTALPIPRQSVTVSIGIAEHPTHGATLDALVRAADSALYQAKLAGRDRTHAADQQIMEAAIQHRPHHL